MIIIPALRLGYEPIPKVATTSMFDWMFSSLGPGVVGRLPTRGERANAVRNYFQFECDDIWRAPNTVEGIESVRGYFRFALTRDPVRRFLSMYANRVVHHGELGAKSRAAPALRAAGLPFNPGINVLVERLEEYRAAVRSVHHHTLPMVGFLGDNLSVFDRLFDISQLGEAVSEIRQFWSAQGVEIPAGAIPDFPRRQTGGPKLSSRILDEEAFERLLVLYADDYRLLPTTDIESAREEYRQAREEASALKGASSRPPAQRWALLAQVDKGGKRGGGAKRAQLTGVVVLSARAPVGVTLRLRLDDHEIPVSWHLPSPQAATRFPKAPGAAKSRFRSDPLPVRGGKLQLELYHPGSGRAVPVLEVTLPPPPPRMKIEEIRQQLASLAPGSEPSEALRAELRRRLFSIPLKARGAAWVELRALLLAKPIPS